MKNLSELFSEVEAEEQAQYKARVASGQDAKEREAFAERSAAEMERLERNGCIEDASAYEGLCPDCRELYCECDYCESEGNEDDV